VAAARQADEVRQLRARVRDIRRAAEFVEAATNAPGPWGRATAAERQGDQALEHGDLASAASLFGQAIRAFREAAGQASERFESRR
jgi:hypothetical protein